MGVLGLLGQGLEERVMMSSLLELRALSCRGDGGGGKAGIAMGNGNDTLLGLTPTKAPNLSTIGKANLAQITAGAPPLYLLVGMRDNI